MKLARTLRLDVSDQNVFEHPAPSGEWAISGGFEFSDWGQGELKGKAKQAKPVDDDALLDAAIAEVANERLKLEAESAQNAKATKEQKAAAQKAQKAVAKEAQAAKALEAREAAKQAREAMEAAKGAQRAQGALKP